MKIPPDSLIIGTVGSLSWIKNQELLISCFAKIDRKDKFLILVGDGPVRQKLMKYASSLGIGDRVYFTGWREDIADMLNMFDIFVLPSLSEGLPMSLLEAMSMSLPCIATRVGGVPEIIKDNTLGRIVDLNNKEELLDAIKDITSDIENARKIGALSREYVLKNFSVYSYIDNILNLYKIEK